jgi:tape measure domain-containing protein
VALADFILKFTADTRSVQRQMNLLRNEARQFSNTLNSGLKTLIGFTATSALVYGMKEAAQAGVTFLGTMEQAHIAFTTMLDDATAASSAVQNLFNFAAKAPLRFEETLAASRRMLAFGWENEMIIPDLTRIGDAAYGLSLGAEGVNRIILALGQMRARTKVTGEEMRQLTEAGIPGWRYLAEAMGGTTKEVMDMTQRGLIPAEQAIDVILTGMEKDFGGLMRAQADSFYGLLSTIQDYGSKAAASILEDTFETAVDDWLPSIREGLKVFSEGLDAGGFEEGLLRAFDPAIARQISGAFLDLSVVFQTFYDIGKEVWNFIREMFIVIGGDGENIAQMIAAIAVAWVAYKTAISGISMVQNAINIALMAASNPLIAVVGVLAAATAGYTAYRIAIEKQIAAEAAAMAQRTQNAVDHLVAMDSELAEYLALMSATQLTADEQERLNQLQRDFVTLAPSIATGIQSQTKALNEQVRAIKLAGIEMELQNAQSDYFIAKEKISDAQKDYQTYLEMLKTNQETYAKIKSQLSPEEQEYLQMSFWQQNFTRRGIELSKKVQLSSEKYPWYYFTDANRVQNATENRGAGWISEEQISADMLKTIETISQNKKVLETTIANYQATIDSYEQLLQQKKDIENMSDEEYSDFLKSLELPGPSAADQGTRDISDSLAKIKAAYDQFKEQLKDSGRSTKTVEEQITDSFDKIAQGYVKMWQVMDNAQQEFLSPTKMMRNIQRQVQYMNTYRDALSEISEKVSSPLLMKELYQLGPEYAKVLMKAAGQDSNWWKQYESLFNEKVSIANDLAGTQSRLEVLHSGTVTVEGVSEEAVTRTVVKVAEEMRSDAARYPIGGGAGRGFK